MKLAILIVLAGSAATFAPSPLATKGLALNMAFEDSLGAQQPLEYSILLDLLPTTKKLSSTVFVTLRSSADVLPCLPLWDILLENQDSASQVLFRMTELSSLMLEVDLMH